MGKTTETTATKKDKAVEVKAAANSLAQYEEEDFLDDSVDTQDLLISKLLLMQGVSQAVNDEKAMAGDLIDSVTLEKLGSGREKEYQEIPIIPLTSNKTWVVYEMIDGQPDWKEEVPMTPQNQNWEQEETVDGVLLRRDRSLNFYVLREDQLEDPTAIPYLISFRRTAYRVGRGLATHFIKCSKANNMIKARRARGENVAYVKPCATIFNLSAKKTSNDTNTWWIPELTKKVTKLDDKHLAACGAWLKTLRAGNHQVDQSEFKEGPIEDVHSDEVGSDGRESF